jgi:3-oxoacid CoA-transferase subunit B
MSVFNSAEAFDMILGGHIDITVLGAYQVSEKGDLANWRTGTRRGIGMGGAMDLAAGAKRLIVAMLHTTKDGKYRIVNECSYPITAKACVALIVTDIAVIEVTREGLVLKEVAPGWTADEVQALTEPKLIVSESLQDIHL